MAESRTAGVFVGVVSSVVAAAVVAWVGIGSAVTPGVTIDGPTLTLQEEPIRLTGHVDGEYAEAYWTDELGERAELVGGDGPLDWYCLGPGTFSVSLIAVMKDGSRQQAKHQVECV